MSCRQSAEKITLCMSHSLPAWIDGIHSLLLQPCYDKLSVTVVEAIMLTHSHFSVDPAQVIALSEEQITQEFALDGAVMQVGSEVIGRVCLHSNVVGC